MPSLVMRSELADTATVLGAPSRQPALPGEPRIGDRLGPYYLQEMVGEGGMGRVFRSVHEKLGRQVAIKLLRRSASFGNGVQRFLREARVVNRVRHPGLPEVTDIVEAPPGGDSYYVMEWLEGKNLHQRMLEHGGRMPAGEYLSVLIDVASALESVHAAGLVHRDLKPENIYLVAGTSGEPERVKVIDFGVALDLQDPGSLKEDDIVGTPAYVAPEQARGETVDGRTDIYAFGVVLYELAVGRLPFEAKTALDSLAKRLEGGPPRPRKAAPRGVDVPRSLERMILRCLETEPAGRYPDMTALRTELIALRQHLQLPPWRRNLFGMASVALPVALLGAASGVLWSERDALGGRARGLWQQLSGRLHTRGGATAAPPSEPAEPLLLEVRVQSTPTGAEVRHGGAVLGTTPCVVRLPEGRQEIELRRGGYRRERRSLDVRVGAQLAVRLTR